MRLVFGVLAAILFIIGAALFIGAVNLIPTDLGLVYLQGGTTVITGGAIILAIGFSAPKHRGRQRRGWNAPSKPSPLSGDTLPRMMQNGDSYPNMTPFTPSPTSEGRGESQHASLMAAFERELETPNTNPPDAVSALNVPNEAQTYPAFADSPAQMRRDDLPELTPELLSASLPVNLAEEEAKLQQPNKQDVGKFDLPPLDMTIGTPEAGARQEVPNLMGNYAPQQNQQEHLSRASSNETAPLQQEFQQSTYSEGGVAHENATFVEESEPQLAPISELEVVGSYESAGTYFTMYSDGSVVTSGEEGERRFSTLDALRAYLAAKAAGEA